MEPQGAWQPDLETVDLSVGEEQLVIPPRDASTILNDAQVRREHARRHQSNGRYPEALEQLNASQNLIQELIARGERVYVKRMLAELEKGFLSVACDWGQSIESADRRTHGHCERVAQYAVAVAEALQLDTTRRAVIQLGAYLHDLGKLRVPPEVLNKGDRLNDAEHELLKLHPVHGVELLTGVRLPWDPTPMIRWHHEKCDGTGYPDGLAGDAIPLDAQIIGIADVYDALSTDRSYRAAMPREMALAELFRCRDWWRPEVYAAFMDSVGSVRPGPVIPLPAA